MNVLQMKILEANSFIDIERFLKRPTHSQQDISDIVRDIYDQIKLNGDNALRDLTHKLDGVLLSDFKISKADISKAESQLDSTLIAAIKQAKENIYAFHKAQMPESISVETMPGVRCWTRWVAIDEIGIYIPGGTAPLFSTVLMLAIPALIAGNKRVALFTPPRPDGSVHPAILYAASICGVREVYKIGGAQAIAAMTLGTEQIRKVDKIFGPGNAYVTEAKMQAMIRGIAIDLPAGPSEVMIIADSTADPIAVASDLLAQLEHGADSQAILLTNDSKFAKEVNEQIQILSPLLPRRNVIEKSIENSIAIVAGDKLIVEIANTYAAEHLIIQTGNNNYFLENICHAGSVFIGPWTPESAGDYASGTNHTLPTYGFARAWSGVNMFSFLKQVTYQEISRAGLESLGPVIETMAKAESLHAHALSVSVRLRSNQV
jgi:histidinol dehydrogenase